MQNNTLRIELLAPLQNSLDHIAHPNPDICKTRSPGILFKTPLNQSDLVEVVVSHCRDHGVTTYQTNLGGL